MKRNTNLSSRLVYDGFAYKTRPHTYHDYETPEQKNSAYWADVYTSGVRNSYLL